MNYNNNNINNVSPKLIKGALWGSHGNYSSHSGIGVYPSMVQCMVSGNGRESGICES